MAIKKNNSEWDAINDNPIVFNVFNYGASLTSLYPPPPNAFMISEILGDFMEMELSTDLMITEF